MKFVLILSFSLSVKQFSFFKSLWIKKPILVCTVEIMNRLGKLMVFGSIFRCLDASLTIAAALSFKSPFVSGMH